MADELRVPPSVTMAFEGAATQICNDAKLDYDEWPLRAYETVTHLQERWRKCIQDGMGTDEAERQALRSFGDFSVVARSHRKPWHVRMLIHQRCRADRFFFFLAAYVFFSSSDSTKWVYNQVRTGSPTLCYLCVLLGTYCTPNCVPRTRVRTVQGGKKQ